MKTESKEPTEGCSCMRDGYEALPPELRPKPRKPSSLRKITCARCGLTFLTNRSGDICIECDRKNTEEA